MRLICKKELSVYYKIVDPNSNQSRGGRGKNIYMYKNPEEKWQDKQQKKKKLNKTFKGHQQGYYRARGSKHEQGEKDLN